MTWIKSRPGDCSRHDGVKAEPSNEIPCCSYPNAMLCGMNYRLTPDICIRVGAAVFLALQKICERPLRVVSCGGVGCNCIEAGRNHRGLESLTTKVSAEITSGLPFPSVPFPITCSSPAFHQSTNPLIVSHTMVNSLPSPCLW